MNAHLIDNNGYESAFLSEKAVFLSKNEKNACEGMICVVELCHSGSKWSILEA